MWIWPWWFGFRLEPISDSDQSPRVNITNMFTYSLNVQNIKAARKMLVKLTRSRNKKVAHIKKGQNRYKIAIPLFLSWFILHP